MTRFALPAGPVVGLSVVLGVALGAALSMAPVAPAHAQAPPPSAFPGEAPASPPAEILIFRAENVAGETGPGTQLRWEAINAYSLSIDPQIGAVATFGTRRVAPAETTTYTLSVTGAQGVVTGTVTVAGMAEAGTTGPRSGIAANRQRVESVVAAQNAASGLARHPDGTPDLSGVFIGGRAIRMAGSVVLTPAAQAAADLNDSDLGQGILCVPPGVPNATLMPFPLQLVHKQDLLVILYEAYHLFRIIPIGVEHPAYLDPSWMGYSVGRWDGDTLVVEVRGFNDRSRVAGNRHTTDMVVTERYTRVSPELIRYEATIEDPAVFAEPVRYAGDLSARPEWEIGEYVCAENNKDYDALFEAE